MGGQSGSREDEPPDQQSQIILAEQADFRLGSLLVRPSLRLIEIAGQEQRLEPRVMQVLIALCEAKGATVSRDSLVFTCWGGVIVGDDAVNRTISRLRRIEKEFPDTFHIETIPRIGFRLREAKGVLSQPSAGWPGQEQAGLHQGWFDFFVEFTTRIGFRRRETRLAAPLADDSTASLPDIQALSRSSHRLRLDRILVWSLVGLIVAGLAVAFSAPENRPLEAPSDGRVAVLPFLSDEGTAMEAYARRMADRLRMVMSVNELPVLARQDVTGYRGADMLSLAGRDGVSLVVDGEVRAEGDHVSAHLTVIDARKNLILWSRHFKRASINEAGMLDQVATHVAYVLRCARIGQRDPKAPLEPSSLALFLKTCDRIHWFDGGSDEALASARALTAEAPAFARGWSILAMSSATASHYGNDETRTAMREESVAAAERALALDPSSTEARLAEAERLPLVGAWSRKEAIIRQVLQGSPNDPDALAALGTVFLETGRMEEAVSAFQRAAAADPLSPILQSNLVPALASLGRQADAAEVRERMVEVWPDSPTVWMHRLHNSVFAGTVPDALRVLAEWGNAPVRMEPEAIAAWRQLVDARADGSHAVLRAAAETFVRLSKERKVSGPPAIVAIASTGALDPAFAMAKDFLGGPYAYTFFLFSPPADALRRDPRFMQLALDVGLETYWRQSGHWPDFCGKVDWVYSCVEVAEALKGEAVSP